MIATLFLFAFAILVGRLLWIDWTEER